VDVVAEDGVGLDVLEGQVDAVVGDDGLDGCAGQGRDSASAVSTYLMIQTGYERWRYGK
jgi:hypothetical protein